MSRWYLAAALLVGVSVSLPVLAEEEKSSTGAQAAAAPVTPPDEAPSAPKVTFSHEKAPAAGQAAVGESRETERLLAVEQRLEAIETKLQRLLDFLDVPAAPDASASTAATQATPPAIARLEEKVDLLLSRLEAAKPHVVARQPLPEKTSPAQGTLILKNWTTAAQYVALNGERFFVNPGSTERSVPLDTVEMYLPSSEYPRRYDRSLFRWNGEAYVLEIDIRQ